MQPILDGVLWSPAPGAGSFVPVPRPEVGSKRSFWFHYQFAKTFYQGFRGTAAPGGALWKYHEKWLGSTRKRARR